MRACGELSYTVLQQVQINFIFNDNVNILLFILQYQIVCK